MLSRSRSCSSHAGIFISGVGGAYRLDGPPTLPRRVLGHPITISLTTDVKCVREALTTNCPSLSRISGLAPTSLPVIFSRMVVFPAFRRPMISTRNRSHMRLRSFDESPMLVRSTKQRSRATMELIQRERGEIESEVQRSLFEVNCKRNQTLSILFT